MGFFSNKANRNAASPMMADAANHAAASDAVFNFKAEALNMAKEAAATRSRELGRDAKPDMLDYFIAAEQLGQNKSAEMAALGIQWGPKVIADLSGQTIDGFTINKADLEPPAALQAVALQKAGAVAQGANRPVTRLDMLKSMQQIRQSGMAVPSMAATSDTLQTMQGIEGMTDLMDLDGDHTVNKFFADVDRHAKFEKTIFAHVSFHPAGTLMRDGENGVALTENASFKDVTFDGMGNDDKVTLAKGHYEGITFTHINKGTVELASGTKVQGIDISGQQAHLALQDGASIDHLKVDETTRVLSLTMGKHSIISNSDLGQSTISMTSRFEPGASFQNVKLSGNVEGLDFSGLRLNNVTIDGVPIQPPPHEQLAALGIASDAHTTANASPELMRNYELAQIRATMQGALNGLNGSPSAKEASPERLAESQPPSLEEIRSTLKTAQNSIGKPLNEQETATLAAIQEANQARQQEPARELTLALHGRNA